MNTVKVTKFGDTNNTAQMVKQLADSVNQIERVLQETPIFYGLNSPKKNIIATKGSLYIRTTQQGNNQAKAIPVLYLKGSDNGAEDWQELIYYGSEPSTTVSAFRGALYLYVPDETGVNAAIYLKESDDATTNGWRTL